MARWHGFDLFFVIARILSSRSTTCSNPNPNREASRRIGLNRLRYPKSKSTTWFGRAGAGSAKNRLHVHVDLDLLPVPINWY